MAFRGLDLNHFSSIFERKKQGQLNRITAHNRRVNSSIGTFCGTTSANTERLRSRELRRYEF